MMDFCLDFVWLAQYLWPGAGGIIYNISTEWSRLSC